jgi:hypothetical protein
VSKKANKGTDKPSSGGASYIKPALKTLVIDKPAIPKSGSLDLKYYNYNRFGYISRNYPEPKIEYIKQVLVVKLVVLTISKLFKNPEQGNKDP